VCEFESDPETKFIRIVKLLSNINTGEWGFFQTSSPGNSITPINKALDRGYSIQTRFSDEPTLPERVLVVSEYGYMIQVFF